MSNFAFLQSEWPLLFEAATQAEGMANTDARASCFYSRRALELTVALDPVVTPELRLEGLARELQSKLQAHRKELDLAVADRIQVRILSESAELEQVVAVHGASIASEVQADSLEFSRTPASGIRIEGIDLELAVVKVR